MKAGENPSSVIDDRCLSRTGILWYEGNRVQVQGLRDIFFKDKDSCKKLAHGVQVWLFYLNDLQKKNLLDMCVFFLKDSRSFTSQ